MGRKLTGRYYDYPLRIELETAAADAAAAFIKRTGEVPNIIFVHPKRHTLDLISVNGFHIPVESDAMIHSPNILYVCQRKEIR